MYNYKLMVQFAYPSASAPLFSEKKDELELAIQDFNKKFVGKKELTLDLVYGGAACHLILKTVKDVSNPTREISAFSQILKYDYNWKEYSTVENRMFDVTLLEAPTEKGIENDLDIDNYSQQVSKILETEDIQEIESYIETLDSLLEIATAKKIILRAQESVLLS